MTSRKAGQNKATHLQIATCESDRHYFCFTCNTQDDTNHLLWEIKFQTVGVMLSL